ncbi:unnamed protein product [Caenorhabditis bovis]|uniref:Multifunctional fusion protein n=1 Tax=Caenorhabditis bovis TaxID=2654633 RepID=A0A8S1ETH1_9PELO|nr:unnamed protein product [Caenorhabditis bovis]
MDRGRSGRDPPTDDVELASSNAATVHHDSTGSSIDFNPFSAVLDRHKNDDDDALPAFDMMNSPIFSKYGDFHTIDWQRDLARDRLRHKMIARKKVDFPLGLLQSGWDAGAGWICVLFVGLASGATAGIIDIGARWMSDLKTGVCADRFWLDKEHCCWSSNDTFYKDDDCKAWTKWPWMLNYYNSASLLFVILEWMFYIGWAVGMATLAVLLVKVFAPYACGSGIPEIKCILSGFVIRGYLGKWTFIIKSVGLILSSASGLSLGKEGPMVHLACCIGNIFSYLFPKYGLNEAKKREILSASAAAGVSVAFGAPIGGVLFSLEEASYYFPLKTMWRSFFCALVAGIILRFVNPFGSNQTSLFHVDYMMKWTFIELVPFAILGLFGGILGSMFIFGNIKWSKFRKNSKSLGGNPIYEVMIITFITAAIAYFNPFTKKSAASMIQQLFDRCEDHVEDDDLCDQNRIGAAFGQLLWALVFKFVITIFTFGIKVPCGLFVPSIAMGAISGRMLGILVGEVFQRIQSQADHSDYFTCQVGKDCVMPGLYAMVGAAAVLGGVTRMTVSLVVIMFELTGSLEFIVPTMVATMFSKWIGDGISKMGIYEAHIELNGYPFLDSKGEYPYSTVASQAMRPSINRPPSDDMAMSDLRELKNELSVITEHGMTLGDIESLLRQTDFNGYPVVVSQNSMHLVGFVTRRDIYLALHTARKTQPYVVTNSIAYFTDQIPEAQPGAPAPLRLRKILDMAPMTVTDQTPMETVIDMFRKLGLRQVLVTKNGKVLGIITKKDILQEKLKEMQNEGSEAKTKIEDGGKKEEYAKNVLSTYTWYHGTMLKENAEPLLKWHNSFVVRRSEDESGVKVFCISLNLKQTISHIAFRFENNKWSCPRLLQSAGAKVENREFDHLHELINFWSTTEKGCIPIPRPNDILQHHMITVETKLGSGAFGDVWKGVLKKSKDGEGKECAVKMIKGDLKRKQMKEFFHEAYIMSLFDHDNVIRYYGTACLADPVMCVMELVTKGNVRSFCRHTPDASVNRFTAIAADIVSGMTHIASKSVIHRDLAARNCLIGGDDVVKISDFGLSVQATEVKVANLKQAPIRWLSPETLNKGIFSEKTDVWSFGVVLWEIFSRCATKPLSDMSNKTVMKTVKDGELPHKPPPLMPQSMADIMTECFKKNADERPTFAQLKPKLKKLAEQKDDGGEKGKEEKEAVTKMAKAKEKDKNSAEKDKTILLDSKAKFSRMVTKTILQLGRRNSKSAEDDPKTFEAKSVEMKKPAKKAVGDAKVKNPIATAVKKNVEKQNVAKLDKSNEAKRKNK